jgi:tripartite-type tricarboxylate transporter receptor subunit TctC
MGEQGYKDMMVMAWFALVGPAGMPEPIVKRLNEETNKALAASDAKERLTNIGFAAAPMMPGEVAKFVAAERTRWLKVAKEHNIKVE